MQLHVKAKQMAFLGLLAAMGTILVFLSTVLETNTFFLLAAAAFFVGIAIREFGLRLGAGFFLACAFLALLLTPNKWYVLTYIGLSLYILLTESSFLLLSKERFLPFRKKLFLLLKLVSFNVIYLPVLFLLPKLIYSGTMTTKHLIILLLTGQVAWLIFDKAYDYFQAMVWGKLRGKISLLH